ncbi:MAG: type III-A CRISPR-associated RAMP protein Csm4 [Candidatus Omnitrophota bacterium]
MIVYKLRFTSPLHLCAGHGGYEQTFHYLHSDTLFSAIISNWNHLYDDSIDSLIQTLPFRISSAFPFAANDYYFPKPLKPLSLGFDQNDYKTIKNLTKVKFVEKDLFEKILNNEARDISFSETRRFMGLKKDVSDCFMEQEISRNAIDRVTGATDIFYFSEIVFREDSGLFFMASFKDNGIRKQFEAVLRFLGDQGIGGDRNVGKGFFEVDVVEDFNIQQPENPDSILNLSLYHPLKEEIDNHLLQNSSYDIIKRRGWVTMPGYQTLRKKSLNMFIEGSIFLNLNRADYGDIPVVGEKKEGLLDFNLYRYGKGFFVGCLDGGPCG